MLKAHTHGRASLGELVSMWAVLVGLEGSRSCVSRAGAQDLGTGDRWQCQAALGIGHEVSIEADPQVLFHTESWPTNGLGVCLLHKVHGMFLNGEGCTAGASWANSCSAL